MCFSIFEVMFSIVCNPPFLIEYVGTYVICVNFPFPIVFGDAKKNMDAVIAIVIPVHGTVRDIKNQDALKLFLQSCRLKVTISVYVS